MERTRDFDPSKFFIDTVSGLLLLLFSFFCFIIANFGTTCLLSIISYPMCALGIIFLLMITSRLLIILEKQLVYWTLFNIVLLPCLFRFSNSQLVSKLLGGGHAHKGRQLGWGSTSWKPHWSYGKTWQYVSILSSLPLTCSSWTAVVVCPVIALFRNGPFNLKFKGKILLSCPHTFYDKSTGVGRSYWNIKKIHLGWSNPLFSGPQGLNKHWYYKEKFNADHC